jgi:PKD repeat protein
MADLSAYDGMSSVELTFSMHATTVVAYAGWYLDDVSISSAASRYGDGGDRATVTLVDEDFEGSFPPADWTVVDNLASCDWERNDYYSRTNYLDGVYCACADIDSCGSGTDMDTELITPTFSLDGMTSATLDFLNYFHSYSYYDQIGTVDISTNGGSTWTTLDTYTLADYTDPVSLSLDAYVGETNCQIRFHFISYDWAYYWEVDNVVITAEEEEEPGPEPSGPGGAVGIMDQGATWTVDILNNTVYDVHSTGWAYGIEVTPTALDPVTQHFEAYLDFEEDFTGVATGSLPSGWTKTPSTTNWGAYASSYSGGVSPEMRFYYSPSSTNEFYVITPEIDTSDFTTLDFGFKHYNNDYNGQYSLRVVTLEGGNEHVIEEWVNPSGGWTATTESYTLTTADGVGASDFQLAWVFDGNSFNINYWYFDDVTLHGSYSYDETVYPWPLDVNIDGNHLSRINLGEGYPCPDDPMYPGVMLTVNYATLPTGGPTPADASEVIAHNNWFDRECFTQCIAILNTDLMHCLDATDNYYSAPDGPGSYNNSAVLDCMTNEPADGQGTQIVNYGPVAFDPWLGLNAVHNQPDIIYATTGEAIFFDGSASWANPGDISFYWKFDDGYYSMEPSIAHTYSSPGTYNGYLRVHNLGIPLFNIPPLYEWDYFTVIVTSPGSPLTANAGGGSLGHYEISISEPLVVSGVASGGTQPYTYSWDLGDGRTVNGQNPIVKYQTEGTYTLTLTVIDANYDVATDTATLTVLGPEELSVSINSPANAGLGQYVTFESIVAGGTAPYTYTWNFGDGITSTLKKPAHIYENEGTYTVTLTVTDDVGQEKTTTTTIEIVGESTGQDPQIKSVKGLFGVKATIAAGDNDCTWSINVDGKYVFSGGQASGTIPANMEQTVKIPLTLALGKTTVTVTAGSITQQYTAFALAPLFLNLK